jgi:hypothetical protein
VERLSCTLPVAGAQSQQFVQPITSPSIGNNFLLAKLDVAGKLGVIEVTNGSSAVRVGVSISLGNGRFGKPIVTSVPGQENAFTVADFNHDVPGNEE